MFDKLKDMGNLMKQAKEMKKEMKKVQDELKKLKIAGTDKYGKVKVAVSGDMDVIAVSIDPELLDNSKKEALEKAIAQATNDALKKAKETASSKLSVVSQGLNIPGLS